MEKQILSLVAYAAITTALLAALRVIVQRNDFYRQTITSTRNSNKSIDGLRGFLALAVVFHHSDLTSNYLSGNGWTGSHETSSFLGRLGVACFFMITAFLFWGKISDTTREFNFKEFYASRIRRIYPMYIFSILCLFSIVALHSGGQIETKPVELGKSLVSWIFLGVNGFPDINSFGQTKLIGAGVYWTMTQEAAFYVLLPLLATFGRSTRALVIGALSGAAIAWSANAGSMIFYFAGGILARIAYSTLRDSYGKSPMKFNLIAAAALLGAYGQFHHENMGAAGACLLFIFFSCVAGGANFAGLLHTPASHLLGTISYSLYLTHGIVLYGLRGVDFSSLPQIAPESYHALFAAGISTAISLVTYRFIEYPFLTRR